MSDRPTRELVAAFADRFAEGLDRHGAVSPLGWWLLLALVAPAAAGGDREELEAALGTDAADAAARASDLLAAPHPAVAAAVALWSVPTWLDPSAAEWSGGLPAAVETGPVPSTDDADRWASEHTDGLVDRFPVTLPADTALVLASALATRVRWQVPFDEVGAGKLGGDLGTELAAAGAAALRAPEGGHRRFVARTEAAGLVGVHAADSGDGLRVVSVIAEPDVAAGRVHRAAGQVAALLGGDERAAQRLSLFDLPLGAGHAWTVTEKVETRTGGSRPLETVEAVLPPWRARTELNLAGAPGAAPAFGALDGLLRQDLRPGRFEARQVTVAAYGREGFEAASVSAVAMRLGSLPESVEVRHRRATIRFARPYAAIALALARVPDAQAGRGEVDLAVPSWDGVPVFSAWVAHADG